MAFLLASFRDFILVGIGIRRRLVADVTGVFPYNVTDGLDRSLALIEDLVDPLLNADLATDGGLNDDIVNLQSQEQCKSVPLLQ